MTEVDSDVASAATTDVQVAWHHVTITGMLSPLEVFHLCMEQY